MPMSVTDQISEYVLGLCETASGLCSFSRDLKDAWNTGSVFNITSALAKLPVALADDPLTETTFLEAFRFSGTEAAWIGSWTTTLGLLDLAYHVIGVQKQQIEYLIAPRFANSCLLTPSNAGTC